MVESVSVATQPSRAAGDLSESWHALRERYARLLVDRLDVDGRLQAVASHALAGGKRLRPMLAELLGRVLRAPEAAVTDVGVAVEYLHTASLMLDDLPCMDDASTRRGAPSTHALYSEAETILAAVALVSRSYAILLQAPVADARGMALLATRTVASIMAPGQAMELARDATQSAGSIEKIHDQKTGALFGLLARLVAACAGASAEATERVAAFASLLGRAYQIVDDIEDRGEPGEARANIARVLEVDDARAEARLRLTEARNVIADADPTGELDELVGWLERKLDATC
jgi:geranylgeranyl diphosphate synthase, type II